MEAYLKPCHFDQDKNLVEPEYDWKLSADKKPSDEKQYVYYKGKYNKVHDSRYDMIFHSVALHPIIWCDKSEHDAKVKLFNDSKVRFEGYVKVVHINYDSYFVHEKKDFVVGFDGTETMIDTPKYELIGWNGIELKIAESLLK